MTKAEKANLANRTKATAGAMSFAYKELSKRLGPHLQHLTTEKRAEVLAQMATEAARIASSPPPGYLNRPAGGDGQ